MLMGGSGYNILIGRTTDFYTNDAALGAILDEWYSGDENATSVAHLQGMISGGKNASHLLNVVWMSNRRN